MPDVDSPPSADDRHGRHNRRLALLPFRAVRPVADGDDLAARLCPPYDVIDEAERERLAGSDPHNAVRLVLPRTPDGGDPYEQAAQLFEQWLADGSWAPDPSPALYVYEMITADGARTRGLVGAVELRDPADEVILPHENTMAGPVADRLALMSATEANLEPIYLVYDGGGAASQAVADVTDEPLADATDASGVRHRLWAITDPAVHDAVTADLAERRALIADGHHRYATYRELQARLDTERGAGPWDFGLTLLVDSTSYGPQVHAIHRVLPGRAVATLSDAAHAFGLDVRTAADVAAALAELDGAAGFAVVLTDGTMSVVLADDGSLAAQIRTADEPAALADLDVTVLHRGLVERVWGLADTVDTVGYAHSVDEALAAAREGDGTAVLLRPTPVAAVAAVAAAGGRMPRKSTLFTPKPASGLLMRRFADG